MKITCFSNHVLLCFLSLFLLMLSFTYFSPISPVAYLLLSVFLILISFSTLFMSFTAFNIEGSSPLTLLGVFLSTVFLFGSFNTIITYFLQYTSLLDTNLLCNYNLFLYLSFAGLFALGLLSWLICINTKINTRCFTYGFLTFIFVLSSGYLYFILFKPYLFSAFDKSFLTNLSSCSSLANIFITFSLVIYCLRDKKDMFTTTRIPIVSLLILTNIYIFVDSTYVFLELSTFTRIICIVACFSCIFYIIFKHCFTLTLYSFTLKLDLHNQNNMLMNEYIEKIRRSQANIEAQYYQIDTMYTKMMHFYPDALFMVKKMSIIHVNGHAERLLKDTSHTLIESSFMKYVSPSYHEDVYTLIAHLLNDQLTQKTIEIQMQLLDNTTLEVEALFTSAKYIDEHTFIVSIKDISDRKQKMALSQQIALEKLKVEFFSTLSHELKTPVNIIYSAVQLQNNLLHTREIKKASYYNTMISQNCMRLLRLLNNLLDMNRIDSNYFHFNPQHINIVSLTESILDSIQPYANRKNIEALFDTEEEEIYAFIDPDLFERILLNLFSNAIKYTPENGHIWVTISTTSTSLSITITDDGVGIPPNKLESIFHRFFRVDSGLIRQAEGAGIGLSLAKSLTELNNGTISVSSQEGEGSCFTLTFAIDTYLNNHPPLDTSYDYITSKDKVDIEFSDVFIS